MPVRAPSSGRAGLTIFGMTLDRKQTYILLAIVAAGVLLLALFVPRAFGDEKTGSGEVGGAPATSAAATATSPAVAAPAPPTTVPTTVPATSAAPSTPPSTAPSTPPSTAPQSSRAPAGGGFTLPAGWEWYRDGTGYSAPVPQGWQRETRNTEVYFREPGGSRRLLIIDRTSTPAPDPVADWTELESDRRGNYRGYSRLGIRPVDYWDKAADWEFTYTSDSGNRLRSVKRGFITAPDQAYGITWMTPEGRWNEYRDDLQVIFDGFRPARS
jgi:hypothetical protein